MDSNEEKTMRLLKAAAAAILLVALVALPPWALTRFIGNPWPAEGVTWTASLTDGAIIGLLAVIVWILWAQLVVCIVVEAISALTADRVQLRAPLTLGVQQQLARSLITAVVLATVTAPLAIGGAAAAASDTTKPASPNAPTSQAVNQVAEAPANPAGEAGPAAGSAQASSTERRAVTGPGSTVTVMRLDSLWSIAERVLGDGDSWPEIAALNEGQTMNDGTTFLATEPIRPGWNLRVPGNTAGGVSAQEDHQEVTSYQVQPGDTLSDIAAEQLGDPTAYPAIFAASQGIAQPGGKQLTDPDHIEPEWTLAIPTTGADKPQAKHRNDEQDPSTTSTGTPNQEDQETATSDVDEPEQTSTPAPTAQVEPNSVEEQVDTATQVDDEDESWPVSTLGGVGAVLAALLIGLLARRRAVQRRRRRPGERLPLPDGPAERVETEVRAVADEVGVEFVDQALRSLSAYTVATGAALPQLQAARMTPAQLDLYFAASPEQPLPTPWQATSDPAVWVLPADQRHLLDDVDPDMPALWPALVSVGHDAESGVILLNLAQLQGLAVTGDHHLTSQVMIALAIELGTAPWANDLDLTVIGSLVELSDVLERGRMRYVPTAHNVRFDTDRVHVVIAMSPLTSNQEEQLLEHGASVVIQAPTIEGRAHQGWAIDLVDAEHATVQPIGLQINPQRVDSVTYASILEMLTASLADPMRPGQDQVVPFDRVRGADRPSGQPPAPRQPSDGPGQAGGRPTMDATTTSRPTAAAGSDTSDHRDLGHNMVSGNTVTTTRTSPEAPLVLVETPVPTPPALAEPEHQVVDDLETARDLPLTEQPPAAAADDDLVVDVAQELELSQEVVELEADSVAIQHPMIRLLGPTVEISGTNTEAPKSESHLRVCTRVATFLALNPDTTRAALIEAIWSGRRVSTSTVDSRISQLRNWLGDNPDTSEAYLPRRSLRFTDAVTTDWNQFVDLVGTDPTQATTEALQAAVRLIRGRPLEGEESKHYGFAEYFAQDVIDILADATYELARRRYMAGEWNTAGSAAALGIRVDPSNERLWRLRIHAAHTAGDAAGVTEAIDRMHARIVELGFELDDETTELLGAIASHDNAALEQARQEI